MNEVPKDEMIEKKFDRKFNVNVDEIMKNSNTSNIQLWNLS